MKLSLFALGYSIITAGSGKSASKHVFASASPKSLSHGFRPFLQYEDQFKTRVPRAISLRSS